MTESEQYYSHYSMQYFFKNQVRFQAQLISLRGEFAQRLGFYRSRDLMMFSDLKTGSSALRTCETALIKVCMAPLPPREVTQLHCSIMHKA